MDDKQYQALIGILERLTLAVESLARAGQPAEPNLVRPLEEYRTFDWASIGASIVREDPDGPTHVEHGGFLYTRRSPNNKFGAAIWYSRADGKDDDGNTRYLKLISFKPLADAEALPRSVEQKLQEQPAGKQPAAPQKPESPAAGRPTGAPAQTAAQTARDKFLTLATGPKHNLTAQAAEAVFDLAAGKDPHRAMACLPFFAEAKTLKLNFREARLILEQAGGDVGKALFAMRDQHPVAG